MSKNNFVISFLWARQHEYLGKDWDVADAVPLQNKGWFLDNSLAKSARVSVHRGQVFSVEPCKLLKSDTTLQRNI
ncbi:MAG TPA: hypothetical protein V6C91_11545 [Coleofasciculaceae cyanobacterium]